MILFKVLFRRYAYYGYILIFLESVFLFNKLNTTALVFSLALLSLVSYKLFNQNDELRDDILFFSNFKLSVIYYRYLFLLIFTLISFLPYASLNNLKSFLLFIDYINLFLLFLILGNRFARKTLFLVLFFIFIALDIYYKLAYTCFTQLNILYALGLVISHSILLFLLLKDYKVLVWKHLII